MRTNWIIALLASCLLCSPLIAADTTLPSTQPAPADPTVAAPKKGSARFFQLHQKFLDRGKQGPIDLLFLGDSITEFWGTTGKAVWAKYYGDLNAANFGISGDRCEHVLWRIDNGELDGIHPKVLVLMIGTNNTGVNTAEQIAAAGEKIVSEIRAKLPDTKILLLAIFPRGPRRGGSKGLTENWQLKMQEIDYVNSQLAKLDDGSTIHYMDITDKFLVDGKIPRDIMPDQLHPSAKGYEIWAEAIQPTLDALMLHRDTEAQR
jgi:lysophospholipase L1-like esterase